MPTVPPTRLDTPTIGVWRRAHGHTGWSDNAQHLLAVTAVQEAQRVLITERLASIITFLDNGATPDQAMNRLAFLLAEWHSR